MPYTVSPSLLPASTEFANVNTSFTITAGMGDDNITSLTVTPDSTINGNIVVAVGTLGGSSVTVNLYGMYNDNFDKTIVYEDGSGNTKTVSRWANVTSGYNLVTNYTPAGGGSKTATYNILVNGTSTSTVTQTINNSSYTPGANYLKQFVAGGKV